MPRGNKKKTNPDTGTKAHTQGREPKITQALIDAIVQDVKLCAPAVDVARKNGISRATFFDWMKFGREGKKAPIYVRFLDAIEQAQAHAKVNIFKLMALGGAKRSTVFLASRIYWPELGRRVEEGEGGGAGEDNDVPDDVFL